MIRSLSPGRPCSPMAIFRGSASFPCSGHLSGKKLLFFPPPPEWRGHRTNFSLSETVTGTARCIIRRYFLTDVIRCARGACRARRLNGHASPFFVPLLTFCDGLVWSSFSTEASPHASTPPLIFGWAPRSVRRNAATSVWMQGLFSPQKRSVAGFFRDPRERHNTFLPAPELFPIRIPFAVTYLSNH